MTFASPRGKRSKTTFDLDTVDFKAYQQQIGPGRGRPDRPRSCPSCDAPRIWFDGWRFVFPVLVEDGLPACLSGGLALKRVCCACCFRSWTLRPAFLYPHRCLQPDLAAVAAADFLSDSPGGTYQQVGERWECSAGILWRWVGWIAGLLAVPELLAEAERLCPSGQGPNLIPREVPRAAAKARSDARMVSLRQALQTLAALIVWLRAQPSPPADHCPLRCWLTRRFLAFRELHRLLDRYQSPPMEGRPRAPPRL
jgi:hypothetical protein